MGMIMTAAIVIFMIGVIAMIMTGRTVFHAFAATD